MFSNGSLKSKWCVALLVVLLQLSAAMANAVSIDWVSVGDPGNAADSTGYGGVAYSYNIGKYEVTAAQYAEFLNAVARTDDNGLYASGMASGRGCRIQRAGTSGNFSYSVGNDWADRPANFVSWENSLRYANWLQNGQPDTGVQDGTTTEDGSYDLSLGASAIRKPGALFFLPSEDEWYKAAYYDPNKPGGAGYHLYPTGTSSTPGRDILDVSGNNANYYGLPYPILGADYYTTEAGEFQSSASPYGTFDQGANVWEWNESLIGSSSHGTRGSAYNHQVTWMRSSNRYDTENSTALLGYTLGFRVASIPEPGTAMLGMVALLCGLWWRKKAK